jgi:cytochrome P450
LKVTQTIPSGWTVPPYVPQELVADLDFYNLPRSAEDPQGAWLDFAKHTTGPIVWSPYNGGHWVIVDPSEIAKIQRDTKNFSAKQNTVPDRGGPRLVPLEADPPEHAAYRKTILPFFTGQALGELEPRIRTLAARLIAELAPRGGCDFIREFALLYPVTIVLQLLGLPEEDGYELNRITDTFARDPDAAKKAEAYGQMTQYIADWVDKRYAEPADDAITKLTQATFEGRPYTRDEVMSTASLLTLGGVDSVAMHLSFITLYLAKDPAAVAYIRDNIGRLDPIVNEFARRFSIANLMRKSLNDFELGGVQIKAGDMVAIPAPLHNLSDQQFSNGEQIDFGRASKPHLTFGTGAHTCVGASLARLEVKIFLEEWLGQIPEFEVDAAKPLALRASATSGVDELWLKWTVK